MRASVYLNGSIVGFHQDPKELADTIRKKRRNGELPWDVNVAYYEKTNEVFINADECRVLRPLLVVENGKSKLMDDHLKLLKDGKLKFSDMVKSGIIEFLDAEEEENAYIATNEKELTNEHTHLEVHPSLMLGVVGALAPFAEYNSVPRGVMTSQMLKQSLGIYASNYNLRTDALSHTLFYPQVPIVKSKYNKISGYENKPAGQNFVIAIMPFYGYNINDAIIINKSAIERGLGRSVFYRTYKCEERRYPGGQKDKFETPKPEIVGYRGDEAYKYLDEDGIIEPEFHVGPDVVLVGKTSPPRFLEEVGELGMLEEKRRENSETMRSDENGTVDWVIITEDESGNKLIKIKTRMIMTPEIGDKFAARHGQKGVIGLIVDEKDMPFTAEGVKPDLCINPHAIPSRMTVGFLLEVLAGKLGAATAQSIDCTPFSGATEKEMEEELAEQGFTASGKEVFYDGVSGNQIEGRIFTGIVYYQRMKHLVALKIHARARGPMQILTRQPTEGRARGGGLRFGEMERDCLIAHGSSMVLMERLLEESDKTIEFVCSKCGMIAVNDQIRKKTYCQACGSSDVHAVEMSHAFKLLLDELKGLGIYPKLKLEDKA